MTIGSTASPQAQHGSPSFERDLMAVQVRTRSMSETFPLWKASLCFVQS
jgi:hypothetical protein